MQQRPDSNLPSDDQANADTYLQPLTVAWSRAAGAVLLLAAVGLAGFLGYDLFRRGFSAEGIAPDNVSDLIFQLMLLVAWGFCAQAGWRLTFSRTRRPGALFSWIVWLALGALVLTLIAIIAVLRLQAAGAWTQRDLQVILFGGGIGGWCLWLAWKSRGG